MGFKNKKYSKLIQPIAYFLDLAILNLTAFVLPFELNFKNALFFYIYITVMWIIISLKNEFYEVYRYSKITDIISLIFRQFTFFFVALYAYIGFFMEKFVSRLYLGTYLLIVLLLVVIVKFLFRYILIKYRKVFGRNIRKVVVLGKNRQTTQLVNLFQEKPEYGFEFVKQFSFQEGNLNLNEVFDFVMDKQVDEIYCSVNELSNKQMEEIIDFSDINIKILKFVPDNKNIFQKKLKFEYYGFLPILSLRDIPLEQPINAFIKRAFDLSFAIFVFVFILSWLMPIIGLLIVLDSPGPIYFKQSRPGLKEMGFYCYKFRSMTVNNTTETSATRNDPRVTRIGRFLRKTSLDELPQFVNVLLGNMSIVGPRPHLWSQNMAFGDRVKKYMIRHFVKPGITGLAQSKGFRGEIETNDDIINRIRYDVFYIENWSFLLDLKIIFRTVANVIKGEDKAY